MLRRKFVTVSPIYCQVDGNTVEKQYAKLLAMDRYLQTRVDQLSTENQCLVQNENISIRVIIAAGARLQHRRSDSCMHKIM